jgi:hypothetical protein
MIEIIRVNDPQNPSLKRTLKEQKVINDYYQRKWVKAAINTICQQGISADFYRYAKDSADILYSYTQDSSIRGFAFVNTINYDNDPIEPLDSWYLNLICISPDTKPQTRSKEQNSKKPSGKDLIERIKQDAAKENKNVKLRALDNVITYYSKIGFNLGREDGTIIERVDEKLASLLTIQKKLNLDKTKQKELTNEERDTLEKEKTKIITSGRFMSAIPDYFTTLNKEGKDATKELIDEGFYMFSPKIQQFLSESEPIKDQDSSLVDLIQYKQHYNRVRNTLSGYEANNERNNFPGMSKKQSKKQSKKKSKKQSKKQSKKKSKKKSKKQSKKKPYK